jgi:hypothetical protein
MLIHAPRITDRNHTDDCVAFGHRAMLLDLIGARAFARGEVGLLHSLLRTRILIVCSSSHCNRRSIAHWHIPLLTHLAPFSLASDNLQHQKLKQVLTRRHTRPHSTKMLIRW